MGMEHTAQCKHIFISYSHILDPWGGVNTYFLLKLIMVHIKLNGIEHKVPCEQVSCPYTHPQPSDGVKRSKHVFFLK